MPFRRTAAVLAVSVLLTALVLATWASFSPEATAKQCRLVFGPDADTELTVTTVGDRLVLEDGAGWVQKLIFADGSRLDDISIEVPSPNPVRYTLTSISRHAFEDPAPGESLFVDVRVDATEGTFEQYCDVELRERSRPSAVAHFDGPLTVSLQTIAWRVPPDTRLQRGGKPTELRVFVGTMDSDRGCWTVTRTHEGDEANFAERPSVEIEFPPRSPDRPALREVFHLDKFC